MKTLFPFIFVLSTFLFFAVCKNVQQSGSKTIPGDYATISVAVTALNLWVSLPEALVSTLNQNTQDM